MIFTTEGYECNLKPRICAVLMNEFSLPVYSNGQVNDIDFYRQADVGIGDLPVQLDTGPLDIRFRDLAFDDVTVRRWSVNRSLKVHSFIPDGWTYFVLCPAAPTAVRWCNSEVRPDTLAIMRSGTEHKYLLPAGWNDVEVGVTDEFLLNRGIAPAQLLDDAKTFEKARLQLPRSFALSLRRWLSSLLNDVSMLEKAGREQIYARHLREIVLSELASAIETGLIVRR